LPKEINFTFIEELYHLYFIYKGDNKMIGQKFGKLIVIERAGSDR
jgi:hypothetical protein